jgi:3-hydroxyacyl-[acyl-carrier-protein] dehydratase
MTLLKSNFYTVKAKVKEEDLLRATIHIHPEHTIFEGHFPGQPVVPGVCMLQLIKEIAEEAMGRTLFLSSANQIKYLNVLRPQANQDISVEIKWQEGLKFNAAIGTSEHVVMKMSGSFEQL